MSKERAVSLDAREVRATLNGTMTQFRRLLRKCDAVEDGYRCPFGVPGDRLWVRETWGYDQDGPHTGPLLFRADRDDPGIHWRPSIHMPRWASRLTLEVEEVRLQDATPADIIAWSMEAIAEDGIDAMTANAFDRNPWVWAVSFKRVQG